jgi:hypothetical protein
MKYEERIGRSKLSVLRDGVRFLRAIFSGVLCYRPEKIFLTAFALCFLATVVMAAYPIEFYLANGRVEEWMIYRFVACLLFGSLGLLLLLTVALTNQMAQLGSRRPEATRFWPSLTAEILNRGISLTLLIAALGGSALAILWPGIVEMAKTGTVYMHWSRLIVGAFALLSIGHVAVFAVLSKVVAIWVDQRVQREYASDAPVEAASVRPFVDVERESA